MLERFLEPSFSKVLEKLVDYAGTAVKDVQDYKPNLETLKENLRVLSAKASDVQEEVMNIELSHSKKRKREVEDWLEDVKNLESEFSELVRHVESQGFISRFLGRDQPKDLIARVERLVEQSRNFGELVLPVCESKGLPLLTKRLVGENFAENLNEVRKFLEMHKLSFIGIYGMGGVGKTTLAKHIHNQFLKESFDFVLWITISQVFHIKSLQDEIAGAIHLDLSNEQNEDKRAARINQALSHKKSFVLILDDLWEKISLEKLGDPLSLDAGKLIITTRSKEVCNQFGCQEVVKVETLEENDAWNLFKDTLGEQMGLTPQIEQIAMRMTEKCGGLPLGIITTAGSMKGMRDIHDWSNALAELDESLMRGDTNEENVFKILKYSFDRLYRGEKRYEGYTTLQRCFLYCCLYPEDCEIGIDELVDAFISEGLLDKKRNRRDRVDQGHAILNKLVNVCLLEETWDFGVSFVKMHDLVRVMALKITEGKYLRVDNLDHLSLKEILDEEDLENDFEKISLMESGIRDLPDGWTPKCPNLSTLLLNRNKELEYIPSSFFWKMHSLHVLNLSYTGINELPNSLSNLGSLKALILLGCNHLKCVPDLRNLKELRELNLSRTRIEEVPRGMEEMVKLECLKISMMELKELPSNWLLNFQNLQCLNLPYHIEAPTEEIERLKKLEEFEGYLKDVFDFNRLMRGQASMQYGSYRICVGEDPRAWYMEKNVVSLAGTKPIREGRRNVILLPHNIQLLCMERCEGLSNCLLDDLECPNINLQSFKTLEIKNCKGIECVTKQEQLLMAEEASNHPFQNLRVLRLINLPDLMEVLGTFQRGGAEVASPPPTLSIFSSLTRLIIDKCNKMKKLGLPVWELQSLEVLEVKGCEEIEEIIEVGGDEDGEGNHYQPPLVHLPKLRRLVLEKLPRLKSICKASMVCVSISLIEIKGITRYLPKLKHLELWELPRLKSLGLPQRDLQSLEWLSVSRCEEIEEIIEVGGDEDGEGNHYQPPLVHLPKLTHLILLGLPRLKSICKASMVCVSIYKIEICGCNKMKKLGLPLWELQSLKWLSVSRCEEIKEIIEVGGDEDGEGNHYQPPLVHLPKLQYLWLIDLPRLKSICKASMACVSIWRIEIHGCTGVKKWPFVFQQLDNDSPLRESGVWIRRSEVEWWESLELEEPSLRTLLQPFLNVI